MGESRWAVRRLALGRMLSATGSEVAAIALSFLVFERTGSAVWLAGTLFFTFGVTGFLTPVSGAIADRFDRRWVMVLSDTLSTSCWVALVFLRDPVLLIGLGFVASVVALPFGVAATAAVPNLVERDDLTWANGLMSAAGNLGRLAGPALGGALYALGGAGLAFAVNAVSFALSAALALSIRGIRFSKSDDRDAEPRGDIMEGFRVVWADDLLRRLTLSGWLLMYLAMNIAFVADPPLATSFGVGALGYGLIDTFFGAGALIGALYARRIDEASERRWFTLGLLGVAAGWGVIAATPWFGLVLAASLGAAALDAVGGVAAYGIVQRRTEDRVRARVFAAMHTLGLFANAIGFLLVGPLVEALGPRAVYAAGGVVALVATAVFLVPARAVPAEAGATPAPPERVQEARPGRDPIGREASIRSPVLSGCTVPRSRSEGDVELPVAERWFEGRDVGDGVTLLWEPYVDPYLLTNVWHVRGRDRDLVVDTANGLGRLRPVIEAATARRSLVAVATHAHFDHIGGMYEFDERWVHRDDAREMATVPEPLRLLGPDLSPAFAEDMAHYGFEVPEALVRALPEDGFDVAAFRTRPAEPTRLLEDGDEIDLGDRRFEVLHVPGHTPGSIALWDAVGGLLFTGDTVYAEDVLFGPDETRFRESLRRLRDLPVSLVCAGHNRPFGRHEFVGIIDEELAG
ncbi:MAG TPA: MFS transporter [Actinomycetota bacterium]